MNTDCAADAATMTVEQASHLLGISRGAAYRAARKGEIPTLRIGRRLLVPTAALHRLLGIPAATDTPPSGQLRNRM